MDRDLVEELAACDRKFAHWFNAMTELTTRMPDQEQAKRIRRVLGTCLNGLEDEVYCALRRDFPDMLPK